METGENMCHWTNCTCCTLPLTGQFTVGKEYYWEYIIDGVKVYDDNQIGIIFKSSVFDRCFQAFEFSVVVTSDSPMLHDKTIYRVFLLIEGEKCCIEEIKAYSRICSVNYIGAKKALAQKRNLVMQGDAYRVKDVCEILQQFKVKYEIDPPYPY